MAMLRSYVSGRWHVPSVEGAPLHDAVTGEEIARISSQGIDMAAALDHGRRVGGPALRELTFHQRAALLKALASHLREHRDELYATVARHLAGRTTQQWLDVLLPAYEGTHGVKVQAHLLGSGRGCGEDGGRQGGGGKAPDARRRGRAPEEL